MALEDEKHCELIVPQYLDRLERVYDTFKFFVTSLSSVVGACVLARLQYGDKVTGYANTAMAIVMLLSAASAYIIIDNTRSWMQLRERMSELAGRNAVGVLIVPKPSVRKSMRIQALMIIVIIASALTFGVINPLR